MSVIQIRLWRRLPNIIPPIFIGIFYYWSLAGAWVFLLDQSVNWGQSIGIHYHYLLEKMFLVQLDSDYLISIWMIGLFLITLQLTMTWVIQRIRTFESPLNKCDSKAVNIYALIGGLFLILSFFVVQDVVSYSLILNESIYLNIRSPHVSHYTIHQLLNWGLVLCLALPLAIQLRNKLKSQQKLELTWLYWIIFVIAQLYLIFIGTRHEVFICGLFLIIYMVYPTHSFRSEWKLILTILSIWIFILGLNDPIRSLSPVVGRSIGLTSILSTPQKVQFAEVYQSDRSFLKHHDIRTSAEIIENRINRDTTFFIGADTLTMKVVDFETQRKKEPEWIQFNGKSYKIPNPHVSTKYQVSSTTEKIFSAVSGMVFSNELFAGHFSMYGVLHYNIQPCYGISFKNLVYSFIPSFVKKERPQDAYGYYAASLQLPSDQGFTINHITAWYLNLGWAGLIIGPVCLGIILFSPLLIDTKRLSFLPSYAPVFLTVMTACFGSILVRSGPESFKTILYEAWIIPMAILGINTLALDLIARFKS
jgi:hypothetical protein